MMTGIKALNSTAGDLEITIHDGDPAQRSKLAEHVSEMIKKGFAVFVERTDGETFRVESYDPGSNEWITKPEGRQGKPGRVSAKDQLASAVAPMKGG